MTQLLKSWREWSCGQPQQEAFVKVKETISSSTVLAFYDPKRPAVARANASGYGIGGVLMQDRRGEFRPVAFCSRTLTEAEGRYVMSEK